MFVLKNYTDKIIISPSSTDKPYDVCKQLSIKYANRLIPDNGISILLKSITDIKSYKIVNGFLQADVIFELVFFKFFVDEIIYGKVVAQEEDHIRIGLPFFDKIYVYINEGAYNKVRTMPENGTKHCTIWYWTYENSKYYVKNNEKVRVRIVEIIDYPYKVIGTLEDQGLGPISWW